MISVKEANDIYSEVLLEPHDIALCSVKNLVVERVNHNLRINAVVPPPLGYPDQ